MPSNAVRRGPVTALAVVLASSVLGAGGALAAAPTGGDGQEDPRFISIRGIEPREDVFFVKGRVEPEYAERRAVLQRRVGRDGRWRQWRTFRTSDTSTYRQQVTPLRRVGRVYYRVRVDSSDAFRTSYSGAVYIRTRRERAGSEGQVEAAVGLDPVDEGLALQ